MLLVLLALLMVLFFQCQCYNNITGIAYKYIVVVAVAATTAAIVVVLTITTFFQL